MKTLTKAIEQIAVKSMRKKSVAAEFSFLLIIFIILKLFTSFVSIVAGYTYLNKAILKLTNQAGLSIAITVIALFLIEFITQISLQRLFKFIYKKQFSFVWLMVLIVGLFFFLSSYLSLKGIAIITSQKADLTAQIVAKYKDQANYITSDYDSQINHLKSQIDLVKKQTWRGKLSFKHIQLINSYNEQIIKLEQEKRQALNELEKQKQAELRQNEIQTQKDVLKYVYIVAVIMLIQLITNAFLNWFYLLIFREKQEYLSDFVATQKQNIQQSVFDTYQTIFRNTDRAILSGLNGAILITEFLDNAKDGGKKTIGFVIPERINENRINENRINGNEQKTDVNRQKTDVNEGKRTLTGVNRQKKYETVKNSKETAKNGIRYCKNCGKPFIPRHHKQLYCSEQCRIDYWEKKTGKKLKFKPKKH